MVLPPLHFSPLLRIVRSDSKTMTSVMRPVGYIQGLLDGIEFKQTAYALDRDSRKAALARFLKKASGGEPGGRRRGA